eukprot:3529-Heterococcus_DN1.PRE.2
MSVSLTVYARSALKLDAAAAVRSLRIAATAQPQLDAACSASTAAQEAAAAKQRGPCSARTAAASDHGQRHC